MLSLKFLNNCIITVAGCITKVSLAIVHFNDKIEEVSVCTVNVCDFKQRWEGFDYELNL